MPAGEVHLWKARTDLTFGHEEILDDDEVTRATRFKLEDHRRRWVSARVHLRLVLSRYLGTEPGSIVFVTAERGRPVISHPVGSGWLSFSPSHSGNLTLLAVAAGPSVGVDVERIRSGIDYVAVARRALGVETANAIAAEAEDGRSSTFFREWVREEARGKCRGTGLVEPDDAVRRDPVEAFDLDVDDGYAGALAVRGRVKVVRRCCPDWGLSARDGQVEAR